MVIDAAKGIEAQTRKLFEVCRLRDVPIITFINKMDREGRDPFELIDEIAETLALDGDARLLADRHGARLPRLLRPAARPAGAVGARCRRRMLTAVECHGLGRPQIDELPRPRQAASCATRSRWCAACAQRSTFRRLPRPATCTPVFFGSALNNFGVRELLAGGLRPGPVAAAAGGGGAPGRAEREQGRGLRLQDPGEHGPQAPGPHRVRAPVPPAISSAA
jgi:peptide chain release factor 3